MNYKELLESQKFRDFLPTKNGIKTFKLRGHDNLEGDMMKVVIDASPERLNSITYYDGMGNQIYPPAYMENDKLVDFIKGVSDENDIAEIVVVGPQDYTKKIMENLKANFTTVNFTLV